MSHNNATPSFADGLPITILESLPVGLLVVNSEGQHTFVNQYAASMTGYSVDELMRGVWVLHPDDTAALELAQSALRDGTSGANYETRVVRKDGSVFWASISWNPLRDSKGQLAGVCTVFVDISDKKNTQEALDSTNQRYRMLSDNASDMFFEWDLDGVISYASASVRQLEYTPDELVGTNIFELAHPDDRPASHAYQTKHLADYQPQRYELRTLAKNGSIRWVEAQIDFVMQDGKPVKVQSVFRDVTERKSAEEELERVNERYRALAENATDILLEWNLQGTVTYVSPSIGQLDYAPEELVGRHILDLSPQEEWPHLRAIAAQQTIDLKPMRHEVTLLARDGTAVPFEAQVDLIVQDGTPRRRHAVARNIGDRKIAEEELRQTNERYRILAENASDIHWEMELDATITYVSQAVRQLGYAPEDWVGRRVFDFVIPEDLEASQVRRERQLVKPQPSRSQVRLFRKDGSVVYLETQVDMIQHDGKPYKFEVVARDITQRKKAEEALLESERLYKSIVESSNDLIMLTTPEGRIAYASPAAPKINGYEPEEMVAQQPWVVHPDDTPAMRASFLLARKGEPGTDVEYRIVTKTGETRWVSHSWSPITDGQCVQTIVSVIRDVTERKRSEEALRQAQEALRESEEKYKSIVENSGDMISLTAPDGTLLYASPAARAITGYEPDELLHLKPWIIHPDDSKWVWHAFEIALQGEPGSDLEYRIVTKFGETRWISHKWAPVYSGEQFQSILGVIRDVTQRKQSEEALRQAQDLLRESEQKYKSIVENSSDLIMLTRPDGLLMYASPAAKEIAGYEPEELMGTIPDIYHPDDLEMIEPVFRRAMRGERGSDFEYRIVTKTGEIKWVSHTWSPIYGGDVLQSILSVVSDVTERKEAEEALRQAQNALRESEQRYKGIVENSNDLIMLNAPDGPIAYASPALYDMLGYKSEEFIGKMPDVVHPEDMPRVHGAFGRAAAGESESNFEYRVLTRSGETKWVSHAWSPIYSGDQLQSIISIVRDITERKKAEEQLRQAHEELEQAYQLQREFLNNVTHEVRTPLTAVQGYTEMLLEGIAGPISQEQSALLQKVMTSSEHLLDVLNAVLQIARMKSGRIALRPRVSDPRLIVEKCIAAVLPQARKKGLEINVHSDADGTVATYDEEKLTIIITNLLGNAVKFTTSGSIDVAVTARTEGCEITVADTGVGIAGSSLHGIFDEFTQLDYPGKHKPSGFGLGLAIVAAMVDAIGAGLTVSSRKGLGTAFTLHVPALQA